MEDSQFEATHEQETYTLRRDISQVVSWTVIGCITGLAVHELAESISPAVEQTGSSAVTASLFGLAGTLIGFTLASRTSSE